MTGYYCARHNQWCPNNTRCPYCEEPLPAPPIMMEPHIVLDAAPLAQGTSGSSHTMLLGPPYCPVCKQSITGKWPTWNGHYDAMTGNCLSIRAQYMTAGP